MVDETVESIGRLGYTPDESEFLMLAAIHSGYFVRRQFSAFLGQRPGGAEARFIEKLLNTGYAQALNQRGNRIVYHLRSKSLYGRLGQTDNRNRREKMPLTIKRKLMCLDFVLMHKEQRFLALEADKVHYFTQERGASLDLLPVRRYPAHEGTRVTDRYFVDKLPVYVSKSLPAPVVHFAYVDEGSESLDGFETFLRQYRPLFDALGAVEIVYVAAEPRWTGKSQRVFERFFTGGARALTGEQARLLQYFDTKRKFEARQFAGLDADRIAQYREEKREFATAENGALYQRWLSIGASALTVASGNPTRHASFRAIVLPFDYDLFGGARHAS
jgi:hypothetical protein